MEFLIKLAELPIKLLKIPVIVILAILNLIPTGVCELLPSQMAASTKAPNSVRIYKTALPGRKLHLGFVLISYMNGSIIKKTMKNGTRVHGVWTEDYLDIRKRWGL